MPQAPLARPRPQVIGRYAIYDEIASGGMASVHFGRFAGASGFARTVAIKRAHPHLVREHEFALMFLDEARLAARIRHPNVVATIDVLETPTDLALVMDYVHGESLWRLLRTARDRDERVPVPIAAAIVIDTLHRGSTPHTGGHRRAWATARPRPPGRIAAERPRGRRRHLSPRRLRDRQGRRAHRPDQGTAR